MTRFRKDALEDFIHKADGSRPPVFVGREDILSLIESHAETGWEGQGALRHGMPKATAVIQGAPGAGKSALLDELKARSVMERAGVPNQSRVVNLSGHDLLSDLPDVIELVGLAGGVPPDMWRRFSSRLALGIDISAVKAEAAMSWTKPDVTRPDSVRTLAKRFPATKWQGPVIVTVDETQRLPRDRYAPHALFLQAIHDGRSTLPLSLVLAGLGDTADVVDRMGLTRLHVKEIGALSTEPDEDLGYIEVMDLMLRFCHAFGLDTTGHESKLIALAAPCEGWPRHLHYALQSLGRTLLEVDGDLGSVDWARIGQEAAESRLQYYRLQQSLEMTSSDSLVATIMSRVPESLETDRKMSMSNLIGLVDRTVKDTAGWRLPKDMDAERLVSHLIHRGALHMGKDKTLYCPIPSFRTYLVQAGGLDPDIRPVQEGLRKGSGDDGSDFGF